MPPLVLVVTDDLTLQEFLAEIIEMAGYRVALASSGTDALHAVDDSGPSVVLLDSQLPLLDGRGVARELRARRVVVRVILMESVASPSRPAAVSGIDAVLIKPFSLHQLLDALARCSTSGPPPQRHGES